MEAAAEEYADTGFGMLTVFQRSDNKIVGRAGLLTWDSERWVRVPAYRARNKPAVEYGVVMGRAFWQRGYAREAGLAIREWAFADLQLPRVIGLVQPGNEAARQTAEAFGMRFDRQVTIGDHTEELHIAVNPDAPTHRGAPD